jgi:type II secretory pathway pseudopilin PulG
MRFASIGTRGVSRSYPRKDDRKRAGFTLLEALVALALVLAFAATLGPYLFHARRIMAGADSRIAAQVLVRTLLEVPFDRSSPADFLREGETNGLRWRITTEPIFIDALPQSRQKPAERPNNSAPKTPNWNTFWVLATVSWGRGLSVSVDTVRLGKTDQRK